MDQIAQTVSQLGSVLRRSAECRRALAGKGGDWDLLPDALALLDDLDEQAMELVSRAGWMTGAQQPPVPGSQTWRTPAALVH